MKHSTKKPTKAEAERMAKIKQMPCAVCNPSPGGTLQNSPTEVHHLLSGNKRLGHMFTIPLCIWHHKGNVPVGASAGLFEELYGPSLARSSKAFHKAFGIDQELLDRTNKLLEKL